MEERKMTAEEREKLKSRLAWCKRCYKNTKDEYWKTWIDGIEKVLAEHEND